MSMARPVAKLLVGLFVLAALLVVVEVILTLGQRRPAPPSLPNPNGYDDVLRASDLVSGDVGEYPTMNAQELRVVVNKNADALKLLEHCRVSGLSSWLGLSVSRAGSPNGGRKGVG